MTPERRRDDTTATRGTLRSGAGDGEGGVTAPSTCAARHRRHVTDESRTSRTRPDGRRHGSPPPRHPHPIPHPVSATVAKRAVRGLYSGR